MDNHSFKRSGGPLWQDDDELRSFIEGETPDEIVSSVSHDFAQELAEIMKGAYAPEAQSADKKQQ